MPEEPKRVQVVIDPKAQVSGPSIGLLVTGVVSISPWTMGQAGQCGPSFPICIIRV